MEKSDTNFVDISVDIYKSKDTRKFVTVLYSRIQFIKTNSTNKVRLKWEK